MDNTVFDDVFRTILEKMPQLVIPLINEAFGTSYPENTPIQQMRNEYHEEDGTVITDSMLKIGRVFYHIECQSTADNTMAIRMFRYDIYATIEHAVRHGDMYEARFPKSCVLFLRSTSHTPDELVVHLTFPDNSEHTYRVPTLKLINYTEDSIFGKRLLMLLPFYVMRYEKQAKELEENPGKLKKLLDEYERICNRLETAVGEHRHGLYADLIGLIVRVAKHIFQDEETVRKEFVDMGGKVLKLKSEELIEQGRKEGFDKGVEQGIEQGEERLGALVAVLVKEGRNDDLARITSDKKYREMLYKKLLG